MDTMREGYITLLILQLMILSIVRAQHDGVRLPPTITKLSPVGLTIYRAEDEIQLECEATGAGTISYKWTKNNSPWNINDFGRLKVEGSGRQVTIKKASGLDAGYYQCFAWNDYGSAMSDTTSLLMATVGEAGNDIRDLYVKEGEPFRIMSQPHKSFPTPKYHWEIALSPADAEVNKLNVEDRMYMDIDGNLYFAYAKIEDAHSGRIYKLITFNTNLDRKFGGSYTKVHVERSSVQNFAPLSNHSFPSHDTTYIGVVGRNVTLPCYFAARPEAEYIWRKPDTSKRADSYEQAKKELVIKNIQPEDEGVYSCTAKNIVGSNQRKLTLQVEAAPTFSSPLDRPRNTNVTEGDTAKFTCKPEGEPAPATVWYMNGKILEPRDTPPRMRFTENNQNLVIDKVCRDCRDLDRSTDLMVIQCNASNTHGYILGTGYLNILKKTKVNLTSAGEAGIELNEPGSVVFSCEAEFDPSTPVAIQWLRIDPEDESSYIMVHPDNKVAFINGGQLMFRVDQNSTGKWEPWLGQYKCEANNTYSSDHRLVTLYQKGDRRGVASLPWWIFVVILLILLLLLLILLCYVYMQRNKGESYPVDEKERCNGNDPEREIEDSGFQDYRRPEAVQPLRTNGGSVSSSIKLHSDDGGSSLNEFGDDPGRFIEDSSLVGAYTGTADRQKGRYQY